MIINHLSPEYQSILRKYNTDVALINRIKINTEGK